MIGDQVDIAHILLRKNNKLQGEDKPVERGENWGV